MFSEGWLRSEDDGCVQNNVGDRRMLRLLAGWWLATGSLVPHRNSLSSEQETARVDSLAQLSCWIHWCVWGPLKYFYYNKQRWKNKCLMHIMVPFIFDKCQTGIKMFHNFILKLFFSCPFCSWLQTEGPVDPLVQFYLMTHTASVQQEEQTIHRQFQQIRGRKERENFSCRLSDNKDNKEHVCMYVESVA